MIRIFQDATLHSNALINLNEKASHHLAHVLRAKIGDTIFVFNKHSDEYEAHIIEITKKNVRVILNSAIKRNVESPFKIILGQGIARGEKMDFIVQKAVELGVHQIIPLITSRTNVRTISDKRLMHWQEVAISACEQCGRNYIPEIKAPENLIDYVTTVNAEKCFVLIPSGEKNKPQIEGPVYSTIALLIGPEGGLTDAEIIEANTQGFQNLTLGPRVLRTETATLVALSIMQFCCGDLG